MPRRHPIKRYLLDPTSKHHTQRQLSLAADLSPGYICDLLKLRKPCGAGAAMKISRASGGAITVDELVRYGRRPR